MRGSFPGLRTQISRLHTLLGLESNLKHIGKAIDFGRMNQPFWRSKGSTLQEIFLLSLKVCFWFTINPIFGQRHGFIWQRHMLGFLGFLHPTAPELLGHRALYLVMTFLRIAAELFQKPLIQDNPTLWSIKHAYGFCFAFHHVLFWSVCIYQTDPTSSTRKLMKPPHLPTPRVSYLHSSDRAITTKICNQPMMGTWFQVSQNGIWAWRVSWKALCNQVRWHEIKSEGTQSKGGSKKLHHELYMYIGAQYMYQTPYRYDTWDAANT